ncbi:hypothetical protein VNI00_013369 [Paramarasmius palmivorus]|uniref:Uncharacterized protein n=1 Tax=Paramarasmius palmivorus TaxID=297713 RepID=A0AAW0BYY9_9AGAR
MSFVDLEEQEERTVSVKTSKRVPSQAASPAKSITKGGRSRAATREPEGDMLLVSKVSYIDPCFLLAQTPAPTQGPVESPPDQDLIQPDGRFKVYIEGPKHKHRAEFMTKSRHTIKKVLAGACKTFNLNPQQARLEKVVIDEDESDIETFEPCQNNQTIGNARIQPGAKLRVVVENYEEEEDDEEEEEEEDY